MSRSTMSASRQARCLIAVALFVALAWPETSRAAVTLETNIDSTLTLALQKIQGVPLTLEEATNAALQQSTTVRDADAALRAARGSLRRERGAFDPEIFAASVRSGVDQPTASPFAGAAVLQTDRTDTEAGGRVRLPAGTELSASLVTTKQETNSAYSALEPQYNTLGRLDLRQPLLKGFGPGSWGERSAATREYEAAQARYDDAVLEIRSQVERTYWDLYAAERDLGVQQIIRERAAALVQETELRAKTGLVGPGDVASAKVFLAEQEQSLIDREEGLDSVSDQIASLIGRRPQGEAPRYRPLDSPPRDFALEPQDSLVARAMRQSLEVKSAERDLAAARAREQSAKWNMLPSLDVVGSVGGLGLSGTGRDVVFGSDTLHTNVNGDFSDTWTQVTKRDYPTWSAGLSLSIPIGFRAGSGEHDRLRGEADRAEQRLIAVRRSLDERVRSGHRDLLNAKRRLDAAQSGVDASLTRARIGLLEYRNGRTTAFEVVQLGADLASAQQRYSQALVRTAKAAAELRRLTAEGMPPLPPGNHQ